MATIVSHLSLGFALLLPLLDSSTITLLLNLSGSHKLLPTFLVQALPELRNQLGHVGESHLLAILDELLALLLEEDVVGREGALRLSTWLLVLALVLVLHGDLVGILSLQISSWVKRRIEGAPEGTEAQQWVQLGWEHSLLLLRLLL